MQLEFVPRGKDHGWWLRTGHGCVLVALMVRPMPLQAAAAIDVAPEPADCPAAGCPGMVHNSGRCAWPTRRYQFVAGVPPGRIG